MDDALLAELDQETKAFVQAMARQGGTDFGQLEAEELRFDHFPAEKLEAPREIVELHEGASAAVYAPGGGEGVVDAPNLLIYFHGGGFVAGDIAAVDAVCQRFARDVPCHVLSLEYRLAPEAKFPAAVNDCLLALTWAMENADRYGWRRDCIAVGGESAGGNLAAVTVQQWCAQGGTPLRLQLLLCPLTDFRVGRHLSRLELADNPVLPSTALTWFEQCYLPDLSERANPLLSPLAAQSLAGLPPAYVVTAALDPLRDEGEAYAEALRKAAVKVSMQRYPTLHGLVGLHQILRQGEIALRDCVKVLQAAFSGEYP